jgi:hypothetical protein
MALYRRRSGYAVAPVEMGQVIAKAAEFDPDPVCADQVLWVLAWQCQFPLHTLSDMGAYALARKVRDIARQAINEAIAELEDEEDT